MEVLIRLTRESPPAGTVMAVDARERPSSALPFVGWLGLLRALAEAIADTAESTDGRRG
jgi:hypothetical protein